MKKRIFTIFLVLLIAVTNMTVCYADTASNKVDNLFNGIGIDNWDSTLDNDDSGAHGTFDTGMGDESESVSGIRKLILDIFSFIPKLIVVVLTKVVMFVFPSMDDIIFNEGSTWGKVFLLSPYFESNGGGFAGNMQKLVSVIYQIFRYIALIGFVIAIAAIAVKMIMSSIGKQKQQYKEALKNWVIGLVLLVVGHWIMIYAIYISEWLVDIIIELKNNIFETTWFTTDIHVTSLTDLFIDALGTSGAYTMLLLGIWAIMAIIAIIMFVVMNMKIVKVYLERVIVVGVLIMIFPLVTVFYAFEKSGIKRGQTFETWLRTFMDQVFIQPVHALTLVGVMVALSAMSSGGMAITKIPLVGAIMVLMVLNTMFTIENVIKRVFAVNGAAMGAPANVGEMVKTAGKIGTGITRNGLQVGRGVYGQLRRDGKTKGQAFRGAMKSGLRSAGKFAVGGKSGQRHLAAVFGAAGISGVEQFFDNERLSQKEQRDATRNLRQAAATENINGKASLKLRKDTKNIERMMDPAVIAVSRAEFGISNKMLDKVLLDGKGSESEQLQVRAYLQSLAEPSTDVGSLVKRDNDGKFEDNGFNYYVASNDDMVKRDLGMVGKLSAGSKPSERVINARKANDLKHPEEAATNKVALGLDDAKIASVENGTADEQTTLAYELYIKKSENPAIDIATCYTTDTSGKPVLNGNMVHNIDMSESKVKDNLKKARAVKRGSKVDDSVVTTRIVYEATHAKEANKIRNDCPLCDEAIVAIESGKSSYEKDGATHAINDDDVLSYKIMVDRMGTGRKLDEYKGSNDKISETIYNGVTMETSDRYAEASDLYMHSSDMLNASSNDNARARSVLVSFRSVDESGFYAKCASKGVSAADVSKFIEGGKSGISQSQIIGILRELATK